GSVGDLHVSAAVDDADVAGAQPPIVEALGRLDPVARSGKTGPARLQLADRLAVPRQLGAVISDDAQLDAGNRPARLAVPAHLVLLRHPRRNERDAAQRAGLGHAPRLD